MTNTAENTAQEQPRPGAPEEPTDEMAKLRQERDEYLDLARRTKAEFENYQKRMGRERELLLKYAYTPLAKDLLPAIDNLDRFLGGVKEESELTRIVGFVRNQIVDAFQKHGIKTIDAQGRSFDPNLHEAVSQVPSAEHPPRTVVQVLETGFQNQDRILRPAKVIVSQPAP